jgi:endonuclease/exonuclease/phosphatase family metal-dependent hydrolase
MGPCEHAAGRLDALQGGHEVGIDPGVDQAAELARLTGLHFAYGKAMDYQGGAYGQALLSRWPLTEFVVHPLPNPTQVEPRIAISAQVRPPGQPGFRFVGTHLDANRDDTAR